MPYIKKDLRKDIDEIVDTYAYHLKADGQLNYFICKLFLKLTRVYGMKYSHAKRFIGELEMAKMEIYRRWVAPYEQQKMEENGDVE